jgi:hypothetical protein
MNYIRNKEEIQKSTCYDSFIALDKCMFLYQNPDPCMSIKKYHDKCIEKETQYDNVRLKYEVSRDIKRYSDKSSL